MRYFLIIFSMFLYLFILSIPSYALGGEKVVNLTLDTTHKFVWSNQEDRVAYLLPDGIYTIKRDGSDNKKIYSISDNEVYGTVAFNYDGTKLYFLKNGILCAINSYTGETDEPFIEENGIYNFKSFPNCNKIIFSISNSNYDGTYIKDLENNSLIKIDDLHAGIINFSKDYQTIYYLALDDLKTLKKYITYSEEPSTEIFNLNKYSSIGSLINNFYVSNDESEIIFLTNNNNYTYYSLYTYTSGNYPHYHASSITELVVTDDETSAYISHVRHAFEKIDLASSNCESVDFGTNAYFINSPEKDAILYMKFSDTYKQMWIYKLMDVTAPSAPSLLKITDVTTDSCKISYEEDGSQWHKIYINGIPYASFRENSSLTYIINNLLPNTKYDIQLSSINYGMESSLSNSITFTTLPLHEFNPIISFPVSDGEYVNDDLTMNIRVEDEELAYFTIYLNGNKIENGSLITEDGTYEVKVVAVGKNGDEVIKTINFTMDQTPPQIIFENFSDGSFFEENFSPEITIADENMDNFSIYIDEILQSDNNLNLGTGTHEIKVEASDLAHNNSIKIANITIIPPKIELLTASMGTTEIYTDNPIINADITYSSENLQSTLFYKIMDNSTSIISGNISLFPNSNSKRVDIDLSSQNIETGSYEIELYIIDQYDRKSETKYLKFTLLNRYTISCEREKLDRVLTLVDKKSSENIINILNILEKNYKICSNLNDFKENSKSMNFGIFIVDSKYRRVTDSYLKNLVKSGSMVIYYSRRYRENIEVQKSDYGLICKINSLDSEILNNLFIQYDALEEPTEDFNYMRKYITKIYSNDKLVTIPIKIDFSDLIVLDKNGENIESGKEIPFSKNLIAITYVKREDRNIDGVFKIYSIVNNLEISKILEALPTSNENLIMLTDYLSTLDIENRFEKRIIDSIIRIVKKLYSNNLNDFFSRIIALRLLKNIEKRLDIIEKRSNISLSKARTLILNNIMIIENNMQSNRKKNTKWIFGNKLNDSFRGNFSFRGF